MLSTKHSSDMKTSGESITTNLDQDVLLSVARYGRAKPSYTTDDLIENYQCGNLNSVVFNQDTAQVPLLTARRQLDTAEQTLAAEIDSYFKESLIYKRNR